MPVPFSPGPPIPGLSRRTALSAGLVLLATACTADPRIESPRGGGGSPQPTGTAATPAPTAPAFPGAADGSAVEVRLAVTATGIATKWRSELDDRRALLTGVRAAHLAHAAALAGPDPTSRPTTGAATSTPPRRPGQSELDDALSDLADAEQAAATEHRARALAATGFSALLWGSMAVAAVAYGQAVAGLEDLEDDDVPGVDTEVERRALPTVSDTAAWTDLVTQLHAVVYGYQLALGRLSGDERDRAAARLRVHRRLRDTVIAQLISRGAQVPDPAPAYVPEPSPTTPARARQLLRRMERALLPFTGLWLASAATPADRAAAYAAMLATDAAARRWGADLLVWPGWNG